MTRFPFSRQSAVLAACALSLCLALAAPAGADESTIYPSDPAARDFTSSAGGWTSSSTFDGSCIPPLLCPTITNAFVPVGGADGNGYITAAYAGGVGINAVAGTSTSLWESPQFAYAGARGEEPTSVTLTMNRRASVDQLLAVEGNTAEYSVQLVDVSTGGAGPTAIAPATLAGADTWRPVPTAGIKPADLKIGDNYRIRIATRYTTGTSVLVTGSADYDNVTLNAVRSGAAGKGNGKGKGAGKGGALTNQSLLALYRSGVANTVVLKGNRLFVRVSCPKKIGRRCTITAQGLLRRHKPATRKRTVKVGKGKHRLVVLRIKPKARSKVAKRKRILVSEKVRAGKATATVYKVRKIIRRH